MTDLKKLPTWAPRIQPSKIRRLYDLDAQGIYDDELLDDVGYSLRARCQSFLEANAAGSGQAVCPSCGGSVSHRSKKEELMHCIACGWELTWGEYFSTIQHKQLSGAAPVLELFEDFVLKFPAARKPQEKMLLIDQLLHGFHWDLKQNPTRPVAVNLIEGRLCEVVAFLDTLSYGEASTPGVAEKREEWVKDTGNVRRWGRSPNKEEKNET